MIAYSSKKRLFELLYQSTVHFHDPFKRGDKYEDCKGYWRHWNCVFGMGNWNWIMRQNRSALFANKFDCNTATSADLVTKIENELMERDIFDV